MADSEHFYVRRRAALVELLGQLGITDEAVLNAVGTVRRELFVSPALRSRAYQDVPLPIGLKQTISQPYTVAFQTMLLGLKAGDKVLEVGTGSGYQAAILCAMGAHVFSVERHRALHLRARAILQQLGYRALTRHGDGTMGWKACAPFDAIVVTAGAPVIPEALKNQLREPAGDQPGGRLVIPVGGRLQQQIMTRIVCTGPEQFSEERLGAFQFVPLVCG